MVTFLNILPCTAIEYLCVDVTSVEDWIYLCGRTPNLTHLCLSQSTSNSYEFDSDDIMDLIPKPMFLTRVHLTLDGHQTDFSTVEWLINDCQSSLQQFKLISNASGVADAERLETLLRPCQQLNKLEFEFQYNDKNVDMAVLLHEFQSDWWLSDCQPAVLVQRDNSGHIVI
ncbi:unnamed protein product, partial [Rotaria sp. Silwood2]